MSRISNIHLQNRLCHSYQLNVSFTGTYAPPPVSGPPTEYPMTANFINIEFYFQPLQGLIGIYYKPLEIIWKDFPNPGNEILLKEIPGYRKNLSSSTIISKN
jgi:hypothetical protein